MANSPGTGSSPRRVARRVMSCIVALISAAGCVSSESRSAVESTSAATDSPATDSPATDSVPGETLVESSIVVAGGPTEPGEATLPESTITVVGAAVGGNSGGEGEGSTNSLSEVVRESDGSCHGWAGPGDAGAWTTGLEEGAPVTYLARETNDVLGTGTLGPGRAVAVETNGVERWMCTFDFTAELTGAPEIFRIQVADLDPWVARPDASRPGAFVASVNTEASFALFSECTDEEFTPVIFDFSVVGEYWSDGIPSVCFAGFDVVGIDRPCRPPTIASDHVIAVIDAEDPNIVYENESGVQVDLATIAPATKVIVVVATGRPC
jgi:hypothetical protein